MRDMKPLPDIPAHSRPAGPPTYGKRTDRFRFSTSESVSKPVKEEAERRGLSVERHLELVVAAAHGVAPTVIVHHVKRNPKK